jgi:hypothetical protein
MPRAAGRCSLSIVRSGTGQRGSERKFGTYLNSPVAAGVSDAADNGRVGDERIRVAELGIVKCTEGFKPELEGGAVVKSEAFHNTAIPVKLSGAPELVVASVAEGEVAGLGEGRSEEPLVEGALGGIDGGAEDDIGASAD